MQKNVRLSVEATNLNYINGDTNDLPTRLGGGLLMLDVVQARQQQVTIAAYANITAYGLRPRQRMRCCVPLTATHMSKFWGRRSTKF